MNYGKGVNIKQGKYSADKPCSDPMSPKTFPNPKHFIDTHREKTGLPRFKDTHRTMNSRRKG